VCLVLIDAAVSFVLEFEDPFAIDDVLPLQLPDGVPSAGALEGFHLMIHRFFPA
jgi:hypothetical protein